MKTGKGAIEVLTQLEEKERYREMFKAYFPKLTMILEQAKSIN